MSADGRIVAFSSADNPVANHMNQTTDAFIRRLR